MFLILKVRSSQEDIEDRYLDSVNHNPYIQRRHLIPFLSVSIRQYVTLFVEFLFQQMIFLLSDFRNDNTTEIRRLPMVQSQVYINQGAQVRTLCRQNERNFALDMLALTSIFGLCFTPVYIIKSNCNSLTYSSLILML